MSWKMFVAGLVLIPVLDFLWLGIVASNFYHQQLGDLARLGPNARIQPVFWAAGVVYFLLALGLFYFVTPQIVDSDSWLKALGVGALFGLIAYGVYDFTNHSTLKSWPLPLLVADVLWGSFVCGVSAVAGWFWMRL